MPTPPLPADVAAFLARPNYATISVVRPDGQPISYPTWYLFENDQIVVNMDGGRRRIEHLRKDPRVALSAMDPKDWISHVSMVGHVADWIDDVDLVDIDRISRHYTGHAYSGRNRPRVTIRIDVDRWHGWGRFKQPT
jgi:PPOX class probable F420-dependent enzyme